MDFNDYFLTEHIKCSQYEANASLCLSVAMLMSVHVPNTNVHQIVVYPDAGIKPLHSP